MFLYVNHDLYTFLLICDREYNMMDGVKPIVYDGMINGL